MGKKIVSKVVTFLTAGLGVVAALAWDDAIRSLFSMYYPRPGEGVMPRFIYAFMVTCIFVIATTIIAHFVPGEKDD